MVQTGDIGNTLDRVPWRQMPGLIDELRGFGTCENQDLLPLESVFNPFA